MRVFGFGVAMLLMSASFAFADVKVVASIKPIHSLVASVMQGAGAPTLIVDGNASPHTYNMKPSDAAMLEEAQVIFWVGHQLEAFLEKPIETLGTKATAVSLLDEESVVKLPMRADENFALHDHGAEKSEHKHEEDEHHHDGDMDGHIWLDPENAKAILKVVAETLSKEDPSNAALYFANAEKTSSSIDALSSEIKATLAPVQGKGFLVFHDAYHYFENRFDIAASGALSINPENPPGAEAIQKLKDQISKGNIQCVFSEPQFDDKLTKLLLEGTTAKAAVLDPEGAQLQTGPELYFLLLRNMSQSLRNCLGAS